jgi:hypothetical protein
MPYGRDTFRYGIVKTLDINGQRPGRRICHPGKIVDEGAGYLFSRTVATYGHNGPYGHATKSILHATFSSESFRRYFEPKPVRYRINANGSDMWRIKKYSELIEEHDNIK